MRLRTKKSLKNQAYRDLYTVSDIVLTTAKGASLNVMIFISLFCGPNNMKFRYSLFPGNITNHECSLLTIHNNNKTFQESWLSIKITTKQKSTWITLN